MCLSRSTYYYEVSKEDIVAKRSEAVACVIREIFEHNKGRYGVRRVHHELINRGYKVNHKKVQRLMHYMDLKGKRPKRKYHSYQEKLERWQITSLTETSVQQSLCKNGQQMFLNSIYLGENATSLQFWICTTNEVISYDSFVKSKHGTDPKDAGERAEQVFLA
jgi:hypothetical protein